MRKNEIFHTSSDLHMAYDLYRNGSDRLVVISHGIFGHRRLQELCTVAERFAPEFDVLVLDCRGHGDTDGRFSFGLQEWKDLIELTESVRDRYRLVGGLGFSFGAFHTCLAAARGHCFDAVTLVAGPKNFQILDHNPFGPGLMTQMQLMKDRKRKRTRLGFDLRPRLMPIECVADIAVPLQIVHGAEDWLIHPSHAEALFGVAKEPKRLDILPEGTHAEYLVRQMPEIFLPLVKGWFLEQLPERC